MPKLPIYELRKVAAVTPTASDGEAFGSKLDGAQSSAQILSFLVDGAGVEQVWVLAVNARRKLIGAQMVSQGSLTQSVAHPREVFRIAIQLGAAGLIVGHNHPSGDQRPSPDDLALTRRLRDAADVLGIPLLDHVIVAEGGHYSYAEHGWR